MTERPSTPPAAGPTSVPALGPVGGVGGALLLTGTVGTGKTTTASAVADLLQRDGVAHAVLDLDEIRRCWPAPAGDPFHLELELRNLAALAASYRAAGADRLVLAGVCENRRDRARYAAAVGAPLTVCRLRARPATLDQRLRGRHARDAPALHWHLQRAEELTRLLDAAVRAGTGVADLEVDTDDRPVPEVAWAVLLQIGWAGSAGAPEPDQPEEDR